MARTSDSVVLVGTAPTSRAAPLGAAIEPERQPPHDALTGPGEGHSRSRTHPFVAVDAAAPPRTPSPP
ncbi:hypothetical protein ACFV23_49220 [Streptomyces sp. NPDC059627]